MMSCARTFTLILIMLALPLQSALAAIMPLCAQAKNTAASTSVELEAASHPVANSASAPCSQHDAADHEQVAGNDSTTDGMTLNLPCGDGVVCHMSSGLPSAASALNLAGGFFYPVPSDSRFTSLTLQQAQRPPLA